MAFRLRLDEPIQKGFRRVGLEQIERARRELAANRDPAAEVHEARKGMKRLRALLRLGREGIGDAAFRTENARFRTIARRLAPARDSHVLLQTVAKLEAAEEAADASIRAGLAHLRAALLARQSAEPADTGAEIAEAAAELERAARRFRRLRIEPDDIATLARGLTRSYRRGLEWLNAAYAENDDETFHEWRKSVQIHWRHMALLTRMWPAMIESRVAAARELSQILGDDHDLALLHQNLAGLADGGLSRRETANIESLIRRRQKALRAAARPRGQLIFAERANAHGRRIVAVWEAAVARNRAESRDDSRDDTSRPENGAGEYEHALSTAAARAG
jgi:hypothetical protein